MADMHNESLLRCYLRQLSVEKLMELLRRGHDETLGELEEQHYEMIEEVILEKEAENPSGKFRDVDTAWEDFVENYKKPLDEETDTSLEDIYPDLDIILNKPCGFNAPNTFSRRKLTKIIAVAATISILVIGLAVVTGAQRNFLSAFADWTQEVFRFGTIEKDSKNASQTKELREALSEGGIDPGMAPTWFPVGYKMASVTVNDLGDFVSINAVLLDETNESNGFGIQYYRYNSGTGVEHYTYEKDNEEVITYESNGRVFYIMSNANSLTATTSNGLCVMLIYGPLSMTDVEKMIDSMGE